MYRLRGLGYALPSRADFGLDPNGGGMHCDPRDTACVQRQSDANNAYLAAMDVAQARNNYEQCTANAQNANSPAQYADVMARCQLQASIQAAPDIPIVTYYTPGQPLSYTPGGPAIKPPQYFIPEWAQTPVPVSTVGGGGTVQSQLDELAAHSPSGVPSGGGAVVPPAGGGSAVVEDFIAGLNLPVLPWWAWAGGAAVVIFGFGGGHGR